MTPARYLFGLGSMVVALVPVVMGARALRRRYLPELLGPVGALGDAVLSLALVVVLSEALGTVGLFALLPIVATFAGAGLVVLRFADRGGRRHDARLDDARVEPPRREPDRVGPFGAFAAIVTVGIVAAEWGTRTADSVRHGMVGIDNLWYHLPVSARFAQSGWTSRLHFVDGSSFTVFFPATSELVHGLGIVFFGNDALSPVLNLGWLAFALLAAWCIGRPFGVAPLTLLGAALVFATPVFTLLDPGGGFNDIVGVALFLAAVAGLLSATRNPRERLSGAALAWTAVAAGLALGTKYTLIPPVAALGIGIAAIGPRGERWRRAALWFAVTGITGGYWYVRNFIATGSPLPSARFEVGPLRLPSIPVPGAESVAKYLFDRRVWSHYYLPGLRNAFGPAWFVLIAAVSAGVVLCLWLGPGRVMRMFAIVAGVSFGAYLVAPQILGNGFGVAPIYFGVNVRYAAPSMVLALVCIPVAVARFERRSAYVLLVLYGAALVATQFGQGIWQRSGNSFSAPPIEDAWSYVIGAAIGAGIFVAAVLLVVLRSRTKPGALTRRKRLRVAATFVVVVSAGGFVLERDYQDHKYANTILLPQIYRWARDTDNTRIAIVGFFLQYPLYGKDSSNFVQYIAIRHENGTSEPIPNCVTWRRVLNSGDYRYVVVSTKGFPFPSQQTPSETIWTRSDPKARLLIHETNASGQAWLYRIDGRLDPARCRSAARSTNTGR